MHLYWLLIAAYPLYLIVFLICQQIIASRHKVRRTPHRPAMPELYMKMLSSVFLILAAVYGKKPAAHTINLPLIRVAGLSIMIAGLWLSMAAQNRLGRNWVGGIGIHKGHQLVTTGPYQYIRHPLYTGMVVAALGYGLVCLDVWLWLTALCVSCAFAFRAPAEERLMHQKFKKRYEAYAMRTGMLFPRLRRS